MTDPVSTNTIGKDVFDAMTAIEDERRRLEAELSKTPLTVAKDPQSSRPVESEPISLNTSSGLVENRSNGETEYKRKDPISGLKALACGRIPPLSEKLDSVLMGESESFPRPTSDELEELIQPKTLKLLNSVLKGNEKQIKKACSELSKSTHPIVKYAFLEVLLDPTAPEYGRNLAARYLCSKDFDGIHNWLANVGLSLEDTSMRRYSALALRGVSDENVVEELLLAAKGDPDFSVRSQAYKSLCFNPSDENLEKISLALEQNLGQELDKRVITIIKQCRKQVAERRGLAAA